LQSWGGKENGFGLAECCQDFQISSYPSSATTLHFEYYNEDTSNTSSSNMNQSKLTSSLTKPSGTNHLQSIHIDRVDQIRDRTLAQLMEQMVQSHQVPKAKQMALFTHLRLAHNFPHHQRRLQCVQARLQALSIIVYCNAMSMQDNFNGIYNGFIEELIELLQLDQAGLLEIKAAALRTLTSVIHLDHTAKLINIIDVTGAASYHGFLPTLVRSCIQALIDNNTQLYTLPFATALFSFLYHLANYESGGEALISCGMIDSLFKVISWKGSDPEHITFVTRAVRVIDLITNLEVASLQTHANLNVFIQRLDYEVDICRKEQPFVIQVPNAVRSPDSIAEQQQASPMDVDMASASAELDPQPSTSTGPVVVFPTQKRDVQCYPQRAAVLKSILNFLKKAIQDTGYADSVRHMMDHALPSSLKHIISNAEYYGPSLFMLAIDVVTVYIFQEPSQLRSLQENGLPDVVFHALLSKEVPATREVLAALPNVFSALCLNRRGLQTFQSFKPFEKIFRVLLSPDYLSAMRRRRSSDPLGDTASNLGSSMDELLRHEPSLRVDAIAAIIGLLKEICKRGTDPNTICSSKQVVYKQTSTSIGSSTSGVVSGVSASGSANDVGDLSTASVDQAVNASGTSTASGVSPATQRAPPTQDQNSSSDDEDDEEDTTATPTNSASATGSVTGPDAVADPSTDGTSVDASAQLVSQEGVALVSVSSNGSTISNQQAVPLVDYILHVMRFLDAILSNNSTDDHCKEFVKQKGLEPLLAILQLPSLPIDFPLTPACLTVTTVCKSILTLAQESDVLKKGLTCLLSVLEQLTALEAPLPYPGGSVLLEELITATSKASASGQSIDPLQCASLTPLLHQLSAAHAYVIMFVHICRSSHSDIRSLLLTNWGGQPGQNVMRLLGQLYTSLVWESTVLLTLCSDVAQQSNLHFARAQLDRLAALGRDPSASTSTASNTDCNTRMDIDECTQFNIESNESTNSANRSSTSRQQARLSKSSPESKQIKVLLTSASRLGRTLAELFSLLVKLCVGSPMRHRRNHPLLNIPLPPSAFARDIASSLTQLVDRALSWKPPTYAPVTKFRLVIVTVTLIQSLNCALIDRCIR
jgi:E3 ubiquitin-protein ligase HUWE1